MQCSDGNENFAYGWTFDEVIRHRTRFMEVQFFQPETTEICLKVSFCPGYFFFGEFLCSIAIRVEAVLVVVVVVGAVVVL